MEGLNHAIKIIGNQSKLARLLNICPQTVSRWVCGRPVPTKYLKDIEVLTGGQVKRFQLRPDLFEGFSSSND